MAATGGCAEGSLDDPMPPIVASGNTPATGGTSGGAVATGGEPSTGGDVTDPLGGGAGVGAEGGTSSACAADESLCSGVCTDLLRSREHCGSCATACTGDALCDAGTCVCPFTVCGGDANGNGGLCVDTDSSVLHCGECNRLCAIGETCVNGACTCQDASLTRCGSLCVNIATNPDNCGACGNTCGETQVCSQSECRDDCLAPETRCDQPDGSVLCADLNTSVDDCGTCGIECEVGYACVAGVCECAPGTELCGLLCVDTQTSLAHCGACDANCTHSCVDGECICEGGLLDCGADCVDRMTDNQHCGTCDNACAEGATCTEGECVCDAGLSACLDEAGASLCVDLLTDGAHCGDCDTLCGEDAVCDGGACACADADLTFCDGECVNLDFSSANCGGCGQPCDAGQICQEGSCATPALIVESTTPDGPEDLETETAPKIRLCNQSSAAVTLNEITIKYWYTMDGSTTNQIATNPWFETPGTIEAVRLDPALTDADWVLTITVDDTPSISPSKNPPCFEFQTSVHGGVGWTQGYIIDNDWSYQPGDYEVNEHITVYQAGNLIWGTEPPPL
jgi:hypothetical protein